MNRKTQYLRRVFKQGGNMIFGLWDVSCITAINRQSHSLGKLDSSIMKEYLRINI